MGNIAEIDTGYDRSQSFLRAAFEKNAVQLFERGHFYTLESPFAKEKFRQAREMLNEGKEVLIVGTNVACHNTGAAAIAISRDHGIRILQSPEEERLDGERYSDKLPLKSLGLVEAYLQKHGKSLADVHAFVNGWNYPGALSFGLSQVVPNLPRSYRLLGTRYNTEANLAHVKQGFLASGLLSKHFKTEIPIIGLDHHDNHAIGSYMLSPFYDSKDQVMVAVIDGYGDDSSVSLYVGKDKELTRVYANNSLFDSLGVMYGVLASGIGGWPPLASEGRLMGASAYGDMNRETNQYYLALKKAELVQLEPEGKIKINKKLINVHLDGLYKPFSDKLIEILGEPVAMENWYKPDHILKAEDAQHKQIGQHLEQQDRLDKAAAVQMIFEDGLNHIIGNFINKTGGHNLILTGGTALNCVANAKLLKRFPQLHLWVPPFCSDTGVALGAALNFAHKVGIRKSEPLQHCFLCGTEASEYDIVEAIHNPKFQEEQIKAYPLGNTNSEKERDQVADMLAYLVASDSIIGLYQGAAESNPRALGHRTILGNPKNPKIRELINGQVKFRETIRPLAPMMTLEAAQKYYDIPEGLSDADYNVLNWMVMAVEAKVGTEKIIPAVVHRDGTSRLQVVRKETDPFTHRFLKAMGKYAGVEVSVNTSLNVGGPIVQTPDDAIKTLLKSKSEKTTGLAGILMIAQNGEAYMVYQDKDWKGKNVGRQLMDKIYEYEEKKSL